MPKQSSFSTYTIMTDAPMIVPDLSADPRFVAHPMVADGGPQARFYAGVPRVLSSGYRFGALCVLDLVPHLMPEPRQMEVLAQLDSAVVAALERAPAEDAAPAPACAASNFLTLVGHELRTPLTVMQGALRLMEGRIVDPVNLRLVQSASRSTAHLGRLIESILKFSHAQRGDVQLDARPVMVSAPLEDVFADHGAGVIESGKRFVTPRCGVEQPMMMDPDHIRICMVACSMCSPMQWARLRVYGCRSGAL